MAEIHHQLVINASAEDVFEAITHPDSLSQWFTQKASGQPVKGEVYSLEFGPEDQWKGIVIQCERDRSVEWKMVKAHEDWIGTAFGFELIAKSPIQTQVIFNHKGWKQASEHFRMTSYYWAMYLRLLKRFLELGEIIPFQDRGNT